MGLLPRDYQGFLIELKERIRGAQIKAAVSINRGLIELYWDLGGRVVERQKRGRWGAAVIERLAADLRREFPAMEGLSSRNIWRMRAFYLAWSSDFPILPRPVAELNATILARPVQELDGPILPLAVAELAWGQNIELIQRLKDSRLRLWYAQQAVQNGWSRPVLVHQIETELHLRQGKALTNFKRTLPAPQSDLAQEIVKDNYAFDFLASAKRLRERDLERGLLDHVQRFLLELGTGFAFVGRQYHLNVGGEDFYLDLLFYHLRLRCFVVIELKTGPFKPEHVGKMSFYLSAADGLLRHAEDRPSIGLILCQSKNKVVAEYALRDANKPIGVSSFRATRTLPEPFKDTLPGVEELERGLGRAS
jgi:predicted nuclease of restriction endonuclease-like (RecB) superfamily